MLVELSRIKTTYYMIIHDLHCVWVMYLLHHGLLRGEGGGTIVK